MRDGLIEVLLQRNKSGEPLEEKEGFVLGDAGDEYHVRVVVHRDSETKNFPFKHNAVKVGLYIDNVDVQYWKRLDLRCDFDATEVIFWGFKQSRSEIKTFVMATPKDLPETKGKKTQQIEEDSLGQIRVVFFEAEVTEDVFSNAVESSVVPRGHHLSENKKFWQQASVVTNAGRDVNKEKFEPIVKWTNISSSPCRTIIINYHTREMLRVMKSIEEDSGSILGKRNFDKNEVVDLTSYNDKDVENTVKDIITDQNEQDGITFMPVTKSVPLLDITGDDEVLTTVNIESSSTIF